MAKTMLLDYNRDPFSICIVILPDLYRCSISIKYLITFTIQ